MIKSVFFTTLPSYDIVTVSEQQKVGRHTVTARTQIFLSPACSHNQQGEVKHM